ncbi:MAG: chemotaxis protein CheW [Myxococcota bacterium]|jgi:two-component system chemotaxis sensor kinase CheA|nr:chemotaxis protein CheW [Myxococcota bacterium]
MTNIQRLAHAMENVLSQLRKKELVPSPALVTQLLDGADSLSSMLGNIRDSESRDVESQISHLERCLSGPPKSQSCPQSSELASRPKKAGEETSETRGPGSESIRVRLGIIDKLMTLAGELVLTRNQLMQAVSLVDDATLSETTGHIDHITTELQDAIMSTRMQSIGTVFHKFHRVVRDLSGDLGKEVNLTLEGEGVELDRNILEAINDPLTHLVRNAMDHGIETPAERRAMGKPRESSLRLSAIHKAGHVIIEIEDDGRGIDPQKIKRKALSMGLLPADQLEAMSDKALVNLIFRPGFSTATKVTDVSGRGVGMDVVNHNLSRMSGIVEVETNVGKGTLVRVKLPLTLAIIPCLLIGEEGECFAIPQAHLVELHRIPARDVKKRIEQIGNAYVMRLRGDLLPLARLRDVLKMDRATYLTPNGREPDHRSSLQDRRSSVDDGFADDDRRTTSTDRRIKAASAVNIAIVAAGNFHFGLIVESLKDSAEIVVKPLGRDMRECRQYAGATILGNGKAALILDVVGISRLIRPDEATEAKIQKEAETKASRMTDEVISLLLADLGGEDRFAVPLCFVERIERIHASQIERVAGMRTMKYRGRSLLLFALDDVAKVWPLPVQESLFVIIYTVGSKEVGLLVANILDIVDSTSEIDDLTFRSTGVYGSIIIENNITLLLDLHGLARHLVPRLAESATDKAAEKGLPTVLVVDDSEFFRNRIREFFEEAGHRVVTANDGLEGMSQLERHRAEIGLVVTDIEMPRMDGFEMTRRMRLDEGNRNLPIIAVTSVSGEGAQRRGKAVGIDEYLIKLDQGQILERSRNLLRCGRQVGPFPRGFA